MKKTVFILIILVVLAFSALAAEDPISPNQDEISTQIQDLDFDRFLNSNATNIIVGDKRSTQQIITDIIKGNGIIDTEGLLGRILSFFRSEMVSGLSSFGVVFAIIILGAIIKAIESSFTRSDGSVKIASFICILCMGGIVIKIFVSLGEMCISTISENIVFIESIMPAMSVLLMTGGGFASAGGFSVILLFLTAITSSVIKNIFIPLTYGYIAISTAGSLFPQVNGIAKFIKSTITLGHGIDDDDIYGSHIHSERISFHCRQCRSQRT